MHIYTNYKKFLFYSLMTEYKSAEYIKLTSAKNEGTSKEE